MLDVSDQVVLGAEVSERQPSVCIDDDVVCEPPRLKVLVAEDDAGDFALIERALSHMSRLEPQITSTSSLRGALFCLASDDFDVVLADWGLGNDCGADLIEAAQGRCPVIVLSGAMNADMTSAAMGRGAAAAMSKEGLDEAAMQAMLVRVLVGGADRHPLPSTSVPGGDSSAGCALMAAE